MPRRRLDLVLAHLAAPSIAGQTPPSRPPPDESEAPPPQEQQPLNIIVRFDLCLLVFCLRPCVR